jgi:hypothetical protein
MLSVVIRATHILSLSIFNMDTVNFRVSLMKMKLKHIPISTQYLCMLASIWPPIKVECSQKPLICMVWTGCDMSLNWTGAGAGAGDMKMNTRS